MTVVSILDDAAAATVLLVLLESTVLSMSAVSPPAPFPHSAVRIVVYNTRRRSGDNSDESMTIR
jgi:hypothetical protein